ncbi:MAG TPA: hypothetical protein VGL89_18245 [Candidatus Koribacter sp.]
MRAKHWQMFLLAGCISLAAPLSVFVATVPKTLVAAMDTLAYALLAGWYWSVGMFLGELLQPKFKVNVRLFLVTVIWPCVYTPFFLWYTAKTTSIIAIFPLQTFDVFCLFYQVYFLARGLEMAEMDTVPVFSQFWGTTVLLFLWPIGIWSVQPRVNNLYGRAHSHAEPVVPALGSS